MTPAKAPRQRLEFEPHQPLSNCRASRARGSCRNTFIGLCGTRSHCTSRAPCAGLARSPKSQALQGAAQFCKHAPRNAGRGAPAVIQHGSSTNPGEGLRVPSPGRYL